MSKYHTPVLLQETIEGLRVRPGKRYIDATVGGGGHGIEIVRRGGALLGIDADKEAVAFASQTFAGYSGSWKIVHGNFRDIESIGRAYGFDAVDGIVFDLGVSSYQLDTPSRGFSYRFEDAPLDLRLDQSRGENAAEWIASASEEELYEVIAKYGEEERAGAIAHDIVLARRISPIRSARQLAAIVSDSAATLSRIFQALRIYVNDELGAIRGGLFGAAGLLVPTGRLAVISFHSLEDRLVKEFMKRPQWHQITKKPLRASESELSSNRRGRSAKLRIAERI